MRGPTEGVPWAAAKVEFGLALMVEQRGPWRHLARNDRKIGASRRPSKIMDVLITDNKTW